MVRTFNYDGFEFKSYELKDAKLLADWLNDSETNRYFEMPKEKSIASMEATISRITNSVDNIGCIIFFHGQPIGIVEINNIRKDIMSAELELAICNSEYRGKGFGKKITQFLIDYIINQMKMKRITARAFSENKAANQLLLNLGFQMVGVFKNEVLKDGVLKDVCLYAYFADSVLPNNNVLSLIGNTPYIKLNTDKWGLKGEIYCKLESFNPTGSVKDRAAYEMIYEAFKRGEINKSTTIIEATSGNLGISEAMVCSVMGLKMIAVAPKGVIPKAKQDLLNALGAKLILTPIEYSYQGSIDYVNRLLKTNNNYYCPSQFSNIDNIQAHLKTTINEIKRTFGKQLDVVVACLGSGGTLMGLSQLKKFNPNLEIYAVEPETCTIMSKPQRIEGHYILGIGPGFVPPIFEPEKIDGVITVSDKEATITSISLAKKEGIYCGISSGAALCAALKYSEMNPCKKILTILPDSGIRYSGKEGFYNDLLYRYFDDHNLLEEIQIEEFNEFVY